MKLTQKMDINTRSGTVLQENKNKLFELQENIKILVQEVLENDKEIKSLQAEIINRKNLENQDDKSFEQNVDKINDLINENSNKCMKENEIVQKLSNIRIHCQKYTTDISIIKEVLETEKVTYETEMNTCKAEIKKLSTELENHVEKLRHASKSSLISTEEDSAWSRTISLYEGDMMNLTSKLADVDAKIHKELRSKRKCTENLSLLKEQTCKLNLQMELIEDEYKTCKVTADMELFSVENTISLLKANSIRWKLEKEKLEGVCNKVKQEQKEKEEEVRKLRTSLQDLQEQVNEKQDRNKRVAVKLQQREKELNDLRKRQNVLSAFGDKELDLLRLETSSLCADINTTKHRLQIVRNTIGAEQRRVNIAEERQRAYRKEYNLIESVVLTEEAEKECLSNQHALLTQDAPTLTTNNELLNERQILEEKIQETKLKNEMLSSLKESEQLNITKGNNSDSKKLEINNKQIAHERPIRKSMEKLSEIAEVKQKEISEKEQEAIKVLEIETKIEVLQRQYRNATNLNQGLRQALHSAREELLNLQEMKNKLPDEVSCLKKKCDQLQNQYKLRMELLHRKIENMKQKSKDQYENPEKHETRMTMNEDIYTETERSLREKWNTFANIFEKVENAWRNEMQ